MLVKSTEMFLEAFQKKIAQKNEVLSENEDRIFWQNLIFFEQNFFWNASRNISVDFTSMFEVSEKFAKLVSLHQ